MELQFPKTTLPCLVSGVRAVRNGEFTQEIRLTDGMPDIGRVLMSWGQVILRSKEWRSGEILASGGVMVWILYAPEDGTQPRCVEGWVPFQLRWEMENVDRDGLIRILPLLRSLDARTVSSRKILVRAGVGAMGEARYEKNIEVSTPKDLPEDVQLLKRVYPVRLPVEAGEKVIQLDEDLEFPGSVPQAEKIYAFTLQPELLERKIMGDKIVYKGKCLLHLVYCCPEEKIHCWDFEIPFSQYSDLEMAYGADAQGDIRIAVTNLELDLLEGGKLRLKGGLLCQHLIEDRKTIEVCEDAYSPFRQVEITMEELLLPVTLESRVESILSEQLAAGLEGEVVDLQFYPDFPGQRRNGENVELELSGLYQALLSGENGSLQSVNARWVMDWKLPADEESRVYCLLESVGRPQSVTSADGHIFSSDLQLQLCTTTGRGIPMLTELKMGEAEEMAAERPSLILLKPGKDELWNVAKRCGSTVDAIQRANNLDGEPGEDRMLLIPVS